MNQLADPAAPSLRAAGPEDAPALSVLATCVYVATYCGGVLRADQAREALANYSVAEFERRLGAGHRIVLAASGPTLLGFADWRPATAGPVFAASNGAPDLRGAAELARLYVAPGAQGRGVGQTLLGRCEAEAAAGGAAWLWLSAWARNARALAFYARAGYADIGRSDYIFEDQVFDNRVFAKRLPPPAAPPTFPA